MSDGKVNSLGVGVVHSDMVNIALVSNQGAFAQRDQHA